MKLNWKQWKKVTVKVIFEHDNKAIDHNNVEVAGDDKIEFFVQDTINAPDK